ncbi:MAG: hypothetical protein QM796_11970 [Chthoniobacteraceae bacterium]
MQTDLQGITLAQQNNAKETSVEALMTVMKGQLQNLSVGDNGAISRATARFLRAGSR